MTIPGVAAQRQTNSASDIKRVRSMGNGEFQCLTICNIAPLEDRKLRQLLTNRPAREVLRITWAWRCVS